MNWKRPTTSSTGPIVLGPQKFPDDVYTITKIHFEKELGSIRIFSVFALYGSFILLITSELILSFFVDDKYILYVRWFCGIGIVFGYSSWIALINFDKALETLGDQLKNSREYKYYWADSKRKNELERWPTIGD